MKRFLRTTKQTFDSVQDKSQYNNSLVLIEDQKCIWSNGVYYGLSSDIIKTNGNGLKYLSDDGTYKEIYLETPSVLPNPESLEIVVVDNNGNPTTYIYDGSTNLQIPIDLSNITSTTDVTFDSDFAPSLQIVGEENQFRLTGDGHILSNDEWEDIQIKLNTLESQEFATNEDIDKIFNGTQTPTPEQPTGNAGVITDDNSIVIDETQLENGSYKLRYIDSEDNVVENFNEITTFEIKK